LKNFEDSVNGASKIRIDDLLLYPNGLSGITKIDEELKMLLGLNF